MVAGGIDDLDDFSTSPHPTHWETDEVLAWSRGVGAGGESVLAVVGEIDASSNAGFATALNGALDPPRRSSLIVDLRGVWFQSAHGIGTLVSFGQRATAQGVRLIVVADSRPVLWPLQLTGADRVLEVHPHALNGRAHERPIVHRRAAMPTPSSGSSPPPPGERRDSHA